MKRLVRWAIYLFIVVLILLVSAALFRDRIVGELMRHNIQSKTGLDTKIEKVTIGAGEITIDGMTLYNSAEFGGTPMLKVPEIHVEYDLGAILARKLHLKLVRLNISEINVVTDKAGRQNFKALQEKSGASLAEAGSGASGFTFTGIDTLVLTIGKLGISNMNSPNRGQEIEFGIEKQVFHDVKSEADLGGVGLLLAARSAFLSPAKASPSAENLLKELTGKK